MNQVQHKINDIVFLPVIAVLLAGASKLIPVSNKKFRLEGAGTQFKSKDIGFA